MDRVYFSDFDPKWDAEGESMAIDLGEIQAVVIAKGANAIMFKGGSVAKGFATELLRRIHQAWKTYLLDEKVIYSDPYEG